jgi:hypothetical protein
MMGSLLKTLLPNRPVLLPILLGPFRGAHLHMNPRHSLRKVFGLYEHELNGWLKIVLPRVTRVLDIGANDGYFTFGCAAAFERNNKKASILAFEPQQQHVDKLTATIRDRATSSVDIKVHAVEVGSRTTATCLCLNDIASNGEVSLVKIDVEGAEIEVLEGGSTWLNGNTFFLIEVHRFEYLASIKDRFERHGILLDQVDQKPLPLLGRETRDTANWWLVSRVS